MKIQGSTIAHGRPTPGQDHDPLFKRFVVVSLAVHLVLLVVAGTMTLIRISGTTYSPSYTVDLVTIPGPPVPAPRSEKKAPAPAKKAEALPAAKKETKAAVEPMREKPVALPRDNRAQPIPHEGDEAARSDRRKKLDELERKAQELFEQFSVREETAVPETAETSGGGETVTRLPGAEGPAGAGGRTGPPSDLRYRAYYDRIIARIYQVWNPPASVSRESEIETVVSIRIAPNGQILDHWIEKKSGNIYYDESVLRAIQAADPLPPIPTELGNDPLEMGLNFIPHQ